jgi:hypothetical protein
VVSSALRAWLVDRTQADSPGCAVRLGESRRATRPGEQSISFQVSASDSPFPEQGSERRQRTYVGLRENFLFAMKLQRLLGQEDSRSELQPSESDVGG